MKCNTYKTIRLPQIHGATRWVVLRQQDVAIVRMDNSMLNHVAVAAIIDDGAVLKGGAAIRAALTGWPDRDLALPERLALAAEMEARAEKKVTR